MPLAFMLLNKYLTLFKERLFCAQHTPIENKDNKP